MESLLFFALLVSGLVWVLGRLEDRGRTGSAPRHADLDRYPRGWPR